MYNFFNVTLLEIVNKINNYLADYILLILLLLAGIIFTVRTKFVQVRCFKEGLKEVFGNFNFNGEKQKSGMSSFQAIATAIAAQVGTGNIVGTCSAILVGGPGAIFWMWVIAFFGMATIYAEAVLAQKTRIVNEDGSVSGGPVYYIKEAFKGKFGKFSAVFFSVAAVIALGFVGGMVQSNSIAGTCFSAFGVKSWITGIIIAGMCAFVFLGNIQRLASVTEKIVPVMAVIYILGSLAVIIARITYIPETFALIFKFAFRPDAAIGGALGFALKKAITQGAKRGLFSNEAGMGSTPHAHAMANVENPHKQGVSAMISVFIDTFIVLTMTALVVISTIYAGTGIAENGLLCKDVLPQGIISSNMAQVAFSSVFGKTFGSIFVAICLLFFAFSTIIGWNLFGKLNFEYLFGKKSIPVYSMVATVCVFLGAVASNDLVWALTDTFNYLMVIPNVLAIIVLCPVVVKICKEFGKKR
ncbi:MAG: alanine:cation symporter family protein [Ruminococcaceae bacterium]|nr:alanine:cation symporter family protein [Oscillospiraceae bacterium]